MSDPVVEAERWFGRHGLPWFVEEPAVRLPWLVRPATLVAMAVVGVIAPAVLVGVVLDGAAGLATGLLLAGLLVVAVAVAGLRVGPMATWALRRTLAQLGALVPLATRALPLLLLFSTFLFLNAEVWELAAGMSLGVLGLVVMVFGGLAVLFLLARLPQEVAAVQEALSPELVRRAVAGTPLQGAATLTPDVTALSRRQRANLVLVLVIVQGAQVLALSALVLAAYVGFGLLVMRPDIQQSWTGSEPIRVLPSALGDVSASFTVGLVQVSLFLAAFSALYFTVAAVTDASYREEFFRPVVSELERAVGVRAAYLALRAR